jgi:D-glycero-D-manno-heptose 1,7-bisphosphate phosphatase
MNKALFLDRDGVINVNIHHLYRIEDCVFIEGIFNFAKNYQDKGYLLIIVTNQAGIAKGLYAETDYFKLRDYIHSEFAKHGVTISAEYYCPHHPDYTGSCNCRKPKPGMLLQAAHDWDIDLSQSVMIGDKESDMLAAKKAGVRERILTNGR